MRSQWTWLSGVRVNYALLALVLGGTLVHGVAQATDCTGFDSQIWAQSVFETNPPATLNDL